MKLMKLLPMLALSVFLTACGHGFEGDYELNMNSGNSRVDKMAGSGQSFTIGGDYIEQNGQRQTFDSISVRDTDNGSYLVFTKGGNEQAWKIIDDQTLAQKSPMGGDITLKRQ